jgi:hypothetical protein
MIVARATYRDKFAALTSPVIDNLVDVRRDTSRFMREKGRNDRQVQAQRLRVTRTFVKFQSSGGSS